MGNCPKLALSYIINSIGGCLEFMQLTWLCHSEEALILRICATSYCICIVPPVGDYTDVITHVNPTNNQCKP